MNWQERFLTEAELQPYLKTRSDYPLTVDVAALIEHQKANWPMLGDGYRALAQIETRGLEADGSSVVVQHNPARLR